MKSKVILLCIIPLLAACSMMGLEKKLYEVRLMDGSSLYSRSKPSLDNDGYYRFNDVNQQRYIINKGSILFIESSQFKR